MHNEHPEQHDVIFDKTKNNIVGDLNNRVITETPLFAARLNYEIMCKKKKKTTVLTLNAIVNVFFFFLLLLSVLKLNVD